MAKRFYDTNLVDQEWYMALSPKHKALYMHLLCKCDVAGVFEVNYRAMSFYVNDEITEQDVFGTFGSRVIPLIKSGSKGIVVDFVCFQCGGCLNANVKAHQAIIRRLKELGITIDELKGWCNHDLTYIGEKEKTVEVVSVNAAEVSGKDESSSVRSKAESEKKRLISEAVDILFNEFWSSYPRRDARKTAHDRFIRIMCDECGCDIDAMKALKDRMVSAVAESCKTDQWTKDGGKFIPMPSTWLNQRRWEDEGLVSAEQTAKEATKQIASSMIGKMTI